MDLEKLYGASYVDWEGVCESWAKRTVAARMLLFAARRHTENVKDGGVPGVDREREKTLEGRGLPGEILRAFASVPEAGGEASASWGAFVDAALVAELEMISYGERPPVLAEVRAGLDAAAGEAGRETDLGRWFAARRDALPGGDLPDDAGYLPV